MNRREFLLSTLGATAIAYIRAEDQSAALQELRLATRMREARITLSDRTLADNDPA